MRIRCSAPGRAGILGNPTDMYGGSVISCSTQERATVEIEPWEELRIEAYGETLTVRDPKDLSIRGDPFDLARAAIEFLDVAQAQFKMTCATELPFQSGLSGSTAMLVAIVAGLFAFKEKIPNRFRLAETTRHIELNYVRVICGYQDAYMCTFGGLHYMDFREKEFYKGLRVEPYATMEPLHPHVKELPLIIALTGVRRVSGAIHKPIRQRWLEGDQEVLRGYLRIAHLARMGKKALLDENWELFGEFMNENHEIQRNLGGSGPENERLIETALDHGAWGAKLAGAGGGGTIIALHPEPERLIKPLKQVGAHRFFVPKPSDGVTVDIEEESEADL